MNDSQTASSACVGRFAPSPSGRMHLGNVAAALLSWLSVRAKGGRWILRIEDLDPQRCRMDHARLIEDDLRWLGLEWDEGGVDDKGPNGPYCQSRRHDIYEQYLKQLEATGLTYPCHCRRSDILATQAPHQSDGRVVYASTCRPIRLGGTRPDSDPMPGATRLFVPDREICFTDEVYGLQSVNLSSHCGDFIVRRADGAWAYQLAVVVDDALMGVTEVVRGNDLLLSAAQQIYLYELLGFQAPRFCHIPLLCNAEGRRLSKRDESLSMEALRVSFTPAQIIGRVAALLGLNPSGEPIAAADLIGSYSTHQLPKEDIIVD
ncbi:MAG: tRNA glutamyl-Q(34) synthetase GluQRS [Bacteroides sp.]|nr:tRNA glutamyl-Q(34) synthetase GluQRS [Bacteroides sp.]MCM1413561.1 tRNA glutamyl-Q(34) synthetase GluQRS [Bacteroides sp.]MCM1471115.1 tRNA glutamyl-Q(34) synthetase GluQRS [Bacteroides sp.]